MNRQIVATLFIKDLVLYFRNKFFAVISILGLIAYSAIYFIMPGIVEHDLKIGFYADEIPPILQIIQRDGLVLENLDSEEALKEAVAEGEYQAGVVLPPDIQNSFGNPQKSIIQVYFASTVPEELKGAVIALLEEFAYLQNDQLPVVDISYEILGIDLLGKPVAPRDRLLPVFAIMVVLTEMLGLASLISEEVESGTIKALIITPVTTGGLFWAKGGVGVGLAFVQALMLLAITGGLSNQPLIILVALLFGSILITGVAFLIASLAKDLMSVMAWGIPGIVILSVPAFSIIFPGAIADWVKIIPTYYLVETIYQAANLGISWSSFWNNMLVLAGFDIVLFWIGIVALRRKLKQ